MAKRDATAHSDTGTKGATTTLRPASLVVDAAAGYVPLARLGSLSHAAARRGGLAAVHSSDAAQRFLAWADALMARWQATLRRLARADFVFAGRANPVQPEAVHHTRVSVQSHERTHFLRPHLTLRLTLATNAHVEQRTTTEVFERTLQALRAAPSNETAPSTVAQVFHIPLGRTAVEQRYRSSTTPAHSPSERRTAPPAVRHERPEMVLRREHARAETRPATRRTLEDEGVANVRATTPHGRVETASTFPPNVTWPDVGALTDQVMQRMQQRLVAQRERLGRI